MRALVVAKAPRAGQVKTRLGAVIGMEAAAQVAAASLLDTLLACRAAFDERHLALEGDLAGACSEDALRDELTDWTLHPQRGATLGERLARAHADVRGPGPTVQVGMDTPQATGEDLRDVAAAAQGAAAVLGPAVDGGWWVLATEDPRLASGLAEVPMSRPDTYELTWSALARGGGSVVGTRILRDVDTVADAQAVAELAPDTHFARAWRRRPR